MALVTKIEDHEQIETGDQSFLRKSKQRSMQKRIQGCLSCSNHTQKISFIRSFPVVQFCVYVKLLLGRYIGQTCSVPILTVKTENEQKEESKMQTSQDSISQAGSQIISKESVPKVTEIVTQSDKLQASVASDEPKLESVIETTLDKPTDQTGNLKDEVTPTLTANAETQTFTGVVPKHTEVVQEPSASDFQSRETIIPTQTVLMPQSNVQEQDSITMDTSVVVEASSESTVINVVSDVIEPSPSIGIELERNVLTSLHTPVLSQTEIQTEDPSASVTTGTSMKRDQVIVYKNVAMPEGHVCQIYAQFITLQLFSLNSFSPS